MQTEILKKVQAWVDDPNIDAKAKAEIHELLEKKNHKELTERFYKDLDFGTAGLRSIMGMGINRINQYTVRKATQAMVNVLKNEYSDPKMHKICVCYDSRNNSEYFAHEVCSVLAANNVTAILFRELNPVPLLSYSVRYYQAGAGIMITASHNPIEYNGFKAYWSDGAQITPPVDKDIIAAYNNITNWNEIKWIDFESALKKKTIQYVEKEMFDSYYAVIQKSLIHPELCKKQGENVRIVYSPIHGTGLKPCQTLAELVGFKNFFVVEEQAKPNGNFPTVKSPNPEYPAALAMAVQLMLDKKADLAMGTDPDTDRLGVAVKHQGEVIFLTGNQIASLFVYYQMSEKAKLKKIKKNSLVLKSVVTSTLQDEIVEHFGGKMEDTLTGFKWMAKKLKDREDANIDYDFIFASEESYGFMGHNEVRDKDAVCAVIQMTEMALFFKEKKMTLINALEEIYEKFGYHHDTVLSLDFLGIEGEQKIGRIMNKLRAYDKTQMVGQTITKFKDYQSCEELDWRNKTKKKFEFTKSNLVCIEFASGSKFYARPSGTEPKIKFYFMIKTVNGNLQERKSQAMELEDQLNTFIKKFADEA
ncbi:MAG: phospho-sugar mutase [Bacteriovoracaceae bacterium]|nr:phospho-sugar mutase [Bacteriovoracaceae bacterium]